MSQPRYTRCMRNDEVKDERRPGDPEPERDSNLAPLPAPAPPLLILATDDDAVCVDDLCLPAEARA